MKATTAYAAKRALINMLTVQAQDGMALSGVQVTYRTPVERTRSDIFGGPVRFRQVEVSGEQGRVIVDETVSIVLIIAVLDEGADVVDTDQEVERLADVLAGLLDHSPYLDDAATMQFVGIASGQGEYDPTRSYGRSTLAVEVDVQCLIQ